MGAMGAMGAMVLLRALAVAVAALGLYPLANALTDGAAVPWWNTVARGWLLNGGAVLGISLVAAILLRDRLDAVAGRARTLVLRVPSRLFAAVVSGAVCVAAAVIAHRAFAGQPFTSDEMAQQWHARILLSGRLWAVAEPFPEFFNTAPVFDRDGRWFSQYPIGGPALIALGLIGNAAWIVNPLLLGAATWALFVFLRRAFGELVARVTILLFAVSPMVLIMGASQMNHVPALTFAMIALAALARWDAAASARERLAAAATLGLSVGVVAMVRPLDAALVALVVGAFQLWRTSVERARWRSIALQIAVGAVPVAILFWANAATTGEPLLFGYEALNGPEHGLGFHLDPSGELHTPRRGIAIVSGYLMRLALYLFEWPLPGTLVVVAGLATVRPASRWDVVLAGLVAAFLFAHGAYWFDGFFAGPRFLFTAVPAFIYFAARAPMALASAFPAPTIRRTMFALVPLCVVWTWTGVSRESALARVASYGEQRSKLKTDVEAQIDREGVRNALVFVNEGWRGRLLARLRVLGVSQFQAERIVSGVDACALQTALDADSGGGTRAARAARAVNAARAFGDARLEPGLPADRAIALVQGSRPTPVCLDEFQRDTAGTMPFPMFLARQRVGSDGRVTGNVIFSRDLGARNELLRERFGDRTWYLYRPPRRLADTLPAFVPYHR